MTLLIEGKFDLGQSFSKFWHDYVSDKITAILNKGRTHKIKTNR